MTKNLKYEVIRSVGKHSLGEILKTELDGSVILDLGYGDVRVNPKYVNILQVVYDCNEMTIEDIYLQEDIKFLKALEISLPS